MADEYLEKWDQLASNKYVSNRYGFKFEARFTKHQGSHMYVSKATVYGLSMARYEAFTSDYWNEITEIDKVTSRVLLPDHYGCLTTIARLPK